MSAPIATLPGVARLRGAAERAWERIDRALLRLQGRVDTPSYDRWMPYGFAALHAALLIVLVLARYHSLDHGVETAKYTQAVWQIGEDLKPITTLSDGNVLAEQGSLILYPLGVITSVLPRTETLLVLRSLALALTIIPLWRLARRHGKLGIGATSAVIFAFSIFPYVHNMNVADFAPAVLAVPALMFAVLAGFDERKRLMSAAIIFALCCRGDLGLAIAGLGILLLIERRRRVGLIATLLGFGWFLVSMYALQRGIDGDYRFLAPYAEFGDTPLRALGGIISHPVRFAKIVGSLANFQILVTLLAPVLFLPLTAPRYLMPAVPLYLLYMGADVPSGRLSEAAQTVPITVFIFVATVFALRNTGRILVKRVRVERRIIAALMLTALVFFVRDSSTSPYSSPWDWGQRDDTDIARLEAVAQIEAIGLDVPVRASSSMLPLLSERLGVYALELPEIVDDEVLDVAIAAATERVDWLIHDRTTDPVEDILRFRSRLAAIGWQRVLPADGEATTIDIYEFTGIIAALPDA